MYKPHLTLDSIYVSRLKPMSNGLYELKNDAELKATPVPLTQSVLMDELAKVLLTTRSFRVEDVALRVGVPSQKLTVCVQVMFGCTLNALIEAYQKRLMLDLVRCTQLSPEDVAQNCGFAGTKSMYNHFTRHEEKTFFAYRAEHQVHRRVSATDVYEIK